MEKLKLFLEFLRKFVELSDDEFMELLYPVITIRKFDKKTIVTREGEIENYFNFILTGLVRKYYKKGKVEINTQISGEGHIMHSQESFHRLTPSEYYIETLEPTTFASISYKDLEKAYNRSLKMGNIGRLVVTYSMVIKDRWQMRLVKHTPRERFIYFVTKNPELIQRVPQKHLASLLHIKPETFSRFKHLLKDHAKKKGLLES